MSTIDNFIVSPCLLSLVTFCGPMHRGDNLSCHSPIIVRLKLGTQSLKKKVSRPSWSKAKENYKLRYKEELKQRLVELNTPHVDCADSMCQDETHVNDKDSFLLYILCSIVETSISTIPKNRDLQKEWRSWENKRGKNTWMDRKC